MGQQQDPVVVYQRIQRLIGQWKIEDHLKKTFTILALGSFFLMCMAILFGRQFAPAEMGVVKPVLLIVLAWVVFMVVLSVAVIRMETRQRERL